MLTGCLEEGFSALALWCASRDGCLPGHLGVPALRLLTRPETKIQVLRDYEQNFLQVELLANVAHYRAERIKTGFVLGRGGFSLGILAGSVHVSAVLALIMRI